MKRGKLRLIYGILLLLSVLMGGCQTKAEKQYEENMAAINSIVSQFNESEDMEEKLDSLKALIELQGTYENGNADIESEFDLQISTMRKYFTDYYNNEINNNTYDYSATDEETLELLPDVIDNLNELLELIQSQGEVTCTNEELNQYEEDINNLIDQYKAIIEEAEKLKREQEEATTTEEVTEATTEAVVNTTVAPANENTTEYSDIPQEDNDGIIYVDEKPDWLPAPADNLFTSGRAYEVRTSGEDGITRYFDNYGYIYNDDGSYTGLNCYFDLY